MNVKKIVVIVAVLLVVCFAVYGIGNSLAGKIYYADSMAVYQAGIMEKSEDGSNYYVRLCVFGLNVPLNEMWVDVKKDFYDRHKVNDQVGALIGHYDMFKVEKSWLFWGSPVKTYERSFWNIENIYESLDEAQKTNPVAKKVERGVLRKKEMGADNLPYIIVEVGDKKIRYTVSKEDYDSYMDGQTLMAEFETIGDFTRFVGFR
ncbi:MAG: hypothetical protein AB9903_17110 [Vulcanimicrobiota bacterium]